MGNALSRRSSVFGVQSGTTSTGKSVRLDDSKENDTKKDILKFTVQPECNNVAWSHSLQKFIGMANIEAPSYEEDNRASMAIICVLDTSGSMSGERISLLRKSVRRLIRAVKATDRIALVEFNTNFKVLLDLTRMDKKSKEKAKTIIDALRARGGTHLCGGILEGMKIAKQRKVSNSNEVCSILLFTDGQANEGIRDTHGILAAVEYESGLQNRRRTMPSGDPETWSSDDVCHWLEYKDLDIGDVLAGIKELKIDGQILMHDLTEWMLVEDLKVSRVHTSKFLREMEKLRQGEDERVEVADAAQLRCTINTFGYGSGHNSDLLEKLAERFDGMYYYVKDVNSIREGFATCLGGLMSTVASRIQLSITPLCGANNVKVLNDFASTWKNGVLTVNIGDIQSEEKRHILFQVDIPKAKTSIGKASYCSVKLSYDNIITSENDVLMSLLDLNRGRVTGQRDTFVDEQHNRIIAGEALRKANEFGRLGRLEQARVLLDEAMETIKSSKSCQSRMSKNLLNDITETRKGFVTFSSYSNWGQMLSLQNTACWRMERAANFTDTSDWFTTQKGYMNSSQVTQVSRFNDSCSDDSDEPEKESSNAPVRALSMRSWVQLRKKNKSAGRLSLSKDAGIQPRNPNRQYINFKQFVGSLSEPKTKPSNYESPKGARLAFPMIGKREEWPGQVSGIKPTKENKSSE